MKKTFCLSFLLFFLPAAGLLADGIGVSGNCALEGSFGLAVCIDSTQAAYVQENLTPEAKSMKMEFLIDPRQIALSPMTRVNLLRAIGPTPSQGSGACQNAVFSDSFQLDLMKIASGPDVLHLRGLIYGDLCGQRATPLVPIAADGPSRVCLEWATEQFRLEPGYLHIAVVPADRSCPADLCNCSEASATVSNAKTRVSFIRLGSPVLNPTMPIPPPPQDRLCLDDVSFSWSGGAFFDDFESGNLSSWVSSVVGGGCS